MLCVFNARDPVRVSAVRLTDHLAAEHRATRRPGTEAEASRSCYSQPEDGTPVRRDNGLDGADDGPEDAAADTPSHPGTDGADDDK